VLTFYNGFLHLDLAFKVIHIRATLNFNLMITRQLIVDGILARITFFPARLTAAVVLFASLTILTTRLHAN
jgi:hypothetical protein